MEDRCGDSCLFSAEAGDSSARHTTDQVSDRCSADPDPDPKNERKCYLNWVRPTSLTGSEYERMNNSLQRKELRGGGISKEQHRTFPSDVRFVIERDSLREKSSNTTKTGRTYQNRPLALHTFPAGYNDPATKLTQVEWYQSTPFALPWPFRMAGLLALGLTVLIGVKVSMMLDRTASFIKICLALTAIALLYYVNWQWRRRRRHSVHQGATSGHSPSNVAIRTRDGAFRVICIPHAEEAQKGSPKSADAILKPTEASRILATVDWCTIFVGGVATLAIINFDRPLETCPHRGTDQQWLIGLSPTRDLPISLSCPGLPLYLSAISAYSVVGLYHLIRTPRCWVEFGMLAVMGSILTGAWLGRRAMFDALILGAYLSLICSKAIQSISVLRLS